MSKYVISKDKSGDWYCHQDGFPYIPVFGSIGSKAKAREYCKMMNGQKHNVDKYQQKGGAK